MTKARLFAVAVVLALLPITAAKCQGIGANHTYTGDPGVVQIQNGFTHYKGTDSNGNAIWGKKP